MTKHILLLAMLALAAGCGQKADTSEADGQHCLAIARQALSNGDIDNARAYIDTLRANYPTALNAREEGILLLDSIELAQAIIELDEAQQLASQPDLDRIAKDSLDFHLDGARQKVKFFEKKIEHDKQNVAQH